jgi:hypothetical protein
VLYEKTAVIGEGQTEGFVYNRALIDLARYYGFHPKTCKPHRAKTKGRAENGAESIPIINDRLRRKTGEGHGTNPLSSCLLTHRTAAVARLL